MQYGDLEAWQLEDLAERAHEMVAYFNRLKRSMEKRKFDHDRIGELVERAAEDLRTLWDQLHYAMCDAARKERDRFGKRRKRPP